MDSAFAYLEPVNAAAKAAFSEVIAESLLETLNSEAFNRVHRCTIKRDTQKFDQDVLKFRQRARKHKEAASEESSVTGAETETETEVEDDSDSLGLIWSGYYFFSLDNLPAKAQLGWLAGKGLNTEIRLATNSFTREHNMDLRPSHIRFNFDSVTATFFTAMSTRHNRAKAAVVNGISISGAKYLLNQATERISIGELNYAFRYSDFSRTERFAQKRREYLTESAASAPETDTHFELPTPGPGDVTIDKWTLRQEIGRGAGGNVFSAVDRSGNLAAVKRLAKTETKKYAVQVEVNVLQELTALAVRTHEPGRIVRLKDVFSRSMAADSLEEIHLVMTPLMNSTLHTIIEEISKKFMLLPPEIGRRHMPEANAKFFVEALRGVEFLHSHGWVHGDLKPRNIGIAYNPPRAVLLDLGSAYRSDVYVAPSDSPQYRQGGTVLYMTPEAEDNGMPADIWAMGIVGFQLTLGKHPWELAYPISRRKITPEQRAKFESMYSKAISVLQPTANDIHQIPTDIEVGQVLLNMLERHRGRRFTISEIFDFDMSESWYNLVSTGDKEQPKRLKMQ